MNLSSPWQCLRCRVAAARRQFSSSSSARGSAETYQKRRFRRGETEGQAKYTPDADGHRSKRERSFGGRALPVTPVLDPKVIEARARWRGPKDPPPKASELTPFQQELWANPHGVYYYQAGKALQLPIREVLTYGLQLTPLQRQSALAASQARESHLTSSSASAQSLYSHRSRTVPRLMRTGLDQNQYHTSSPICPSAKC